MRGVVATVTSCVGGKDDRFAVLVTPAAPQPPYFVYKTWRDFDALWAALERLAADVKRQQAAREASLLTTSTTTTPSTAEPPLSLVAQWLASVVDHYAFRAIVAERRAQDKDAMSALNVMLHFLVRRVSALYVEHTILRAGVCRVSRRLAKLVRGFLEFEPAPERSKKRPRPDDESSEPRPEEAEAGVDMDVDVGRPAWKRPNAALFPPATADRSPKAQKLGSASEFCLPPAVAALPTRRRVFAEVDF